LQGTPY
jgi:hypothetical protein